MAEELPIRRRLWHDVPYWVRDGSWFFITVNCATRGRPQLTLPDVAPSLLDAARFYHDQHKWHLAIFLLMPDHWHAIMSFERESAMSSLFRHWKRYTATQLGIDWQDGFFDHRLRGDDQMTAKFHYIQRNPVVLGLCENASDWPHQLRRSSNGLVAGGTSCQRESEGGSEKK